MTIETLETESEKPAVSLGILRRIDTFMVIRAVVTAAIAIVVFALGLIVPQAVWAIGIITFAGLTYGCWPIIIESWHDIRAHHMSMDLSMLIAIAAAAAIGQWVTSLIITVFVLAAEILEDLCMDSGRSALQELMAFLPQTVSVVGNDDQLSTIALAQVTRNMVVRIFPGGRVPVDGTVVAGSSELDQSRITGESALVQTHEGSTVFAGSVNQQGLLDIKATGVGVDSSYGKIIETVKESQNSQAPVQKLADRMATALVSVAVVGAIITAIITRNATSAIDVIIVAGACGIAAGTPLAMLACIARAARSGAFVKDGTHMETLSSVDTVIFDKTGTVTLGKPVVVDMHPISGVEADELLTLAASAESNSEHVLGKAIVQSAMKRNLEILATRKFNYTPGFGITCEVEGNAITVGNREVVPESEFSKIASVKASPVSTMSYVMCNHRCIGAIEIEDRVRPSAPSGIAALKAMGMRTVMLTGDRKEVAEYVTAETGIDSYRSDLKPEHKLEIINELRSQGRIVAMVGDGVNDAPALTRANVGIAMGSGTDIAQESADVVLVSSRLHDVARMITIARQGRRVVAFNFVGTIVVDVIGMVLAAFGILTPLVAALVHVGSESGFILNSARLLPHFRSSSNGRT
ncbi:MAG: cation-translocating P-type ATPase [Bifidobacterium aquikefiri]|uniref:Copper-translocating P-type ATPase n=1 Tax=Bifidobacterium aquikefiri TaxID=1653207 RepID=A0A261G868_9BIFI|nr:cation-translocating P-type ATPase [Bifidobacterium aquikefiri]OZG67608.1 copper-translocating P-type ATPase [Bifidobacterium aquikefiri]